MGTAPWLRLYCADAGSRQPEIGPHSTLEELWEHKLKAACRCEETVEAYEQTLQLWRQFTGSPPLSYLAENWEAVYTRFVSALEALPGRRRGRTIKNTTINKHLRHLRRFLNAAKQRGLLPARVKVEFLPPDDDPKVAWTPQEIQRLLRHTHVAVQPRRAMNRPEVLWRAIILVGYYTGLRRKSLFEFTPEQIEVVGETTWLVIYRDQSKRRKPHRVPLVPRAYAALRGLVTLPGKPVLGWPGWNGTTAERQLKAICRAAGFPPGRVAGFHALRRACATQLIRHNPSVARMVLGHVKLSTTETYYADLAQIAHEAFDRLESV